MNTHYGIEKLALGSSGYSMEKGRLVDMAMETDLTPQEAKAGGFKKRPEWNTPGGRVHWTREVYPKKGTKSYKEGMASIKSQGLYERKFNAEAKQRARRSNLLTKAGLGIFAGSLGLMVGSAALSRKLKMRF